MSGRSVWMTKHLSLKDHGWCFILLLISQEALSASFLRCHIYLSYFDLIASPREWVICAVSFPCLALMGGLSLSYSCEMSLKNESTECCENKHICPAVDCCFTVDPSGTQIHKSSQDQDIMTSNSYVYLMSNLEILSCFIYLLNQTTATTTKRIPNKYRHRFFVGLLGND